MVRKARRSASQWDSGMPMVPLKPRESGDTWMVFLCLSVWVGCIFQCLEKADFVSVCYFPKACWHSVCENLTFSSNVDIFVVNLVIVRQPHLSPRSSSFIFVLDECRCMFKAIAVPGTYGLYVPAYMCSMCMLFLSALSLCASKICGFRESFRLFPALFKSLAMRWIHTREDSCCCSNRCLVLQAEAA